MLALLCNNIKDSIIFQLNIVYYEKDFLLDGLSHHVAEWCVFAKILRDFRKI